MKIDPITGKAYHHDWERDLNRIWKAGYSYGYLSWVNPQTDEEIFQVDAIKHDEFRAVGRGKEMTEAVEKLIVELKDHGFPSHILYG
jgi:hypothetical protein